MSPVTTQTGLDVEFGTRQTPNYYKNSTAESHPSFVTRARETLHTLKDSKPMKYGNTKRLSRFYYPSYSLPGPLLIMPSFNISSSRKSWLRNDIIGDTHKQMEILVRYGIIISLSKAVNHSIFTVRSDLAKQAGMTLCPIAQTTVS